MIWRKIEEHEGKHIFWLIVICQINYYTRLTKVIATEKFNHNKILVDTDDKLSDDITFVISMTCVIKGDDKFYPQIFLKEALLVE